MPPIELNPRSRGFCIGYAYRQLIREVSDVTGRVDGRMHLPTQVQAGVYCARHGGPQGSTAGQCIKGTHADGRIFLVTFEGCAVTDGHSVLLLHLIVFLCLIVFLFLFLSRRRRRSLLHRHHHSHHHHSLPPLSLVLRSRQDVRSRAAVLNGKTSRHHLLRLHACICFLRHFRSLARTQVPNSHVSPLPHPT